MSLLQRWSSRVFSVELDGAPVYFSIRERHRGEEAPRPFRALRPGDRCYSLLVCGGDRVARAKFHWELRDGLSRDLPPGCELSPMSSFLPGVKGSLIKGYFVKDSCGSASSSERLLRGLAQRGPVLVCSYPRGESGRPWTQRLWSSEDSPAAEVPGGYYVVPSEAPECHPSTLNIVNSDVFYSFDEAHEVLKKVPAVRL